MGLLNKMATNVSYALGLDGFLSEGFLAYLHKAKVQGEKDFITFHANDRERLNELLSDEFRPSIDKRMMANGLAKLTDELKNEILWERGDLMKSVCAWCKKEMGYKPGNGIPKQETHGICKPCAEKVKREANNELYKFRRSE